MAPCRREPVRNQRGILSRLSRGKGRSRHLTLVLLVGRDLFRCMLNLQEQLNTFNWRDGRFGDGSRNTTGDEVLGEGEGISRFARHFQWFSTSSNDGKPRRECAREETSSTKGTSRVLADRVYLRVFTLCPWFYSIGRPSHLHPVVPFKFSSFPFDMQGFWIHFLVI